MKIQRKIVIVGAHPDDPEISGAGTICDYLQKRFNVIVIYLTKGEKGGDPKTRKQESIDACKILGVQRKNIIFGPFKDTAVPQSYEVIKYLEQFATPDIYAVFIPSAHDFHQDHRAVNWASLTAFRRMPRLFACESPTSTPDFKPNIFIDINSFLVQKRKALNCHKSQLAQRRSYLEYDSMIHLAKFRGHQAGVEYAEAYEVVRCLI